MKLPAPRDRLAGCVWLPRIVAKGRLISAGTLEPEYASRFGHVTGVDGQFLSFFALTKEDILAAGVHDDEQVTTWFTALPSASAQRIQEWNHIAVNLGRSGFPLAERLPQALATTYAHLADKDYKTIFEVIETDEKTVA
jgi:hypothetical protein